jgi:hypothetical protein
MSLSNTSQHIGFSERIAVNYITSRS